MRKATLVSLLSAMALLPAVAVLGVALAGAANSPSDDAPALIQAGHWKRARAILEPQVKAYPQDPQSAYLLTQVKAAFKDFDGALPLAQHAVELDGKNSNYHLKLGQIYGEMAARASIFAAGSLAVKFRKEVEIALDLDPKNLEALDSMMQFKFQAPGLMGGSKTQARALAEEITSLSPSEGYLAHAELAELEKNPSEMEANYLKAVEADPKNYPALTTLARFYSSPPQLKLDAATKYAQQAWQLDPSRADAGWILARVFSLEERWSDLQAILVASEKNVPDDLRPFYEAARALLEIGKEFPRAEGYAKKYLSEEPEGEEPDAADAHRLLGLVFEREGRISEGRTEIETTLQLRPNFKAAKEDLKRMDRR
ncbi:MAG: tetratricopeptide repeat protein [Terriglobia bacterium]|jgi:tetratricopeptide (TPR) repeat protein